jgi:spermidine/putrescine transport system ATP-binding protein
MTALVSVQSITHHFAAARVLDNVSLEIAPGSYTVLLGPSGSGKTTLLSILGGFLTPDHGRIMISGVDCTSMAPAKRPTATVFQDYALFPHMTIGDNVGFGLRMKGVGKTERNEKALSMLRVVGLETSFNKKPHQLSGGQRQRVALARALVVDPAVLLLDEPLGALDLKLRRQMQDELKTIQKRVGTAFVHVTHDQEEAMALADHVVVVNQGRIEDEGTPERVYAQPATRFSATFMGESTIIDADVLANGQVKSVFGVHDVEAPIKTGKVKLAIRPEHVSLSGNIPATVRDVVYQGSFKRIVAISKLDPDLEILCRVSAETTVAKDDMVGLQFAPDKLVVLRD